MAGKVAQLVRAAQIRDSMLKQVVPPRAQVLGSSPGLSTNFYKMATKQNSSCLQKALDDEPIFVLRAKDPSAPKIIAQWCASNLGEQPNEKIDEAMKVAQEMRQFRTSNYHRLYPKEI